jgi:hypothetical protein
MLATSELQLSARKYVRNGYLSAQPDYPVICELSHKVQWLYHMLRDSEKGVLVIEHKEGDSEDGLFIRPLGE